jgi:multiple sugar transport system substrate-binding protein
MKQARGRFARRFELVEHGRSIAAYLFPTIPSNASARFGIFRLHGRQSFHGGRVICMKIDYESRAKPRRTYGRLNYFLFGGLIRTLSRFIKQTILVLLLAMAMYALVYGKRSALPLPAGTVELQYWEKWGGVEAAQMKEIVTDFNNTVGKDKNIYINYQSIALVDRKVLLATAAGTPPDIAGVWDGQLPAWAAIDAIEPLDDLAKAHGITPDIYKPIMWKSCTYEGHLYAVVSTPGNVALIYNRKMFQECAKELRAAGCDPDRAPETIDELNKYAAALDKWETIGNRRRLVRTGYHPLEPGWYVMYTPFWWGGKIFDEATQRLVLDDAGSIASFKWMASFSDRLGVDASSDFHSGMAAFNTPQNAFLIGQVAMEQQGPWMANYIEMNNPAMNHLLYPPGYDISKLTVQQRRDNCAWAAAPFPSADGRKDVNFVGTDLLILPRGCRHKTEAFEFLAYCTRQDVAEKLNMLHCKPSPLARVSEHFLHDHPNPYIDVFERLCRSPNAYRVPQIPIWSEVGDELTVATQKVFRHEMTAEEALHQAQQRMQLKWETYQARRAARLAGQGE